MINGIKDFLLKISFILISLQIIHLAWLTCNVTLPLFNYHYLMFNDGSILFVLIDYIEIPSLIIASSSYIFLILNGEKRIKNSIFTSLLLLQFIHILYLTDQFIVDYLHELPLIVVFFVVLIDYSELSIVWDLGKRIFVRKRL